MEPYLTSLLHGTSVCYEYMKIYDEKLDYKPLGINTSTAYLPTNGGHIAQQYFEYNPRSGSGCAAAAVDNMKSRRYYRECAGKDWASKPHCNNIIPLIGSEGSGKSAFLINFPNSEAYRNYCGPKEPIVSTLSFGGSMESPEDDFGLRVVYGTLKAMDLFPAGESMSWVDFQGRFVPTLPSDFQVFQAIKMIRNAFQCDESRKIIVLVDDLQRVKNSTQVWKELTMMVDNFDDLDLIVSSRSHEQITQQEPSFRTVGRNFDKIAPLPLMPSSLGEIECFAWAEALANRVGCMDPEKINVLRNAYLLFSGHPKSLQRMAEKFVSSSAEMEWDTSLSHTMQSRSKSAANLLWEVVETFKDMSTVPCLTALSTSEVVSSFLDWHSHWHRCPRSQQTFESGYSHVHTKNSPNEFFYATETVAMLHWLRSAAAAASPDTPEGERTSMTTNMLRLFTGIENESVSTLLERVVAATIVSRSFTAYRFYELFDDNWRMKVIAEHEGHLQVAFDDINERQGVLSELTGSNTLTIAPEGLLGYAFRVAIRGSRYDCLHIRHHVYAQVAVAQPDSDSIERVLATSVCHSLADHMRLYHSGDDCKKFKQNWLRRVQVLLYYCCDTGASASQPNDPWTHESYLDKLSPAIDETQLLIEVDRVLAEMLEDPIKNGLPLPKGFNRALVRRYLSVYWDNVLVFGRLQTQEFVLPSLWAVPLFAQRAAMGSV